MADLRRVVAVYGHEAEDGEALRDLAGPEALVVPGGRELIRALARLRRSGEEACVVPMTLGRDPELVADTARTLRALPAAQTSGTLLAEPFATARHLIAWLRAAANRAPETSALLVTAPAGGPFDDAELYRIARLVHGYDSRRPVEVAFTGGDPDPAEGVRRCALLGASRVTLLPAGFHLPEVPGVPGVEVTSAGPTVSRAALARVLAERVADAGLRWSRRRDDGVGAGLTAADDHGHSHTHPPGEGHDHARPHPHPHVHPHVHGADHVTRSTV
ncbi:cobalamin biosynthesis protein CbiX [Streptomyces sp. NBC_01754]|uniref:cobalamin biosynthesis protein CbiX n=1 Tax=Streptomyces sp. NBC_01754 TaxID=2975930 RepID=UPI002DD8B5B9|nr:cobalamin biosynthesis protein CbiX [Streptomyces sp. NBC_01754]WSC91923.1 cobalamin biosynthesis protein CbiX [Streptomyces sp. NBC_01754]